MSCKYRHKPTEVRAIRILDQEGTVDLTDFPIEVKVTPLRECITLALQGPTLLFRIEWCDSSHKTGDNPSGAASTTIEYTARIIARQYSNSEGFYLSFMDGDSFRRNYDPIE